MTELDFGLWMSGSGLGRKRWMFGIRLFIWLYRYMKEYIYIMELYTDYLVFLSMLCSSSKTRDGKIWSKYSRAINVSESVRKSTFKYSVANINLWNNIHHFLISPSDQIYLDPMHSLLHYRDKIVYNFSIDKITIYITISYKYKICLSSST